MSSSDIPSREVIDALERGLVEVTRRVEIYESDAVTRWNPDDEDEPTLRLIEGNVTVDYNSDERRKLDVSLENIDQRLRPNSNGGLWYDKVLKVFRGVKYATADAAVRSAIVEAEGNAMKFANTLASLGYPDADVRLDETDFSALSDYDFVASVNEKAPTAKSAMLKSLFDQGKNILTVGVGSGTAELPHYSNDIGKEAGNVITMPPGGWSPASVIDPVVITGPSGLPEEVVRIRSVTNIQALLPIVNVDPNKMYEISFWLLDPVKAAGTQFYFGVYEFSETNANITVQSAAVSTGLDNGIPTNNFYFTNYAQATPEWKQFVAYLYPHDATPEMIVGRGVNVPFAAKHNVAAKKVQPRILNYSNDGITRDMFVARPSMREVVLDDQLNVRPGTVLRNIASGQSVASRGVATVTGGVHFKGKDWHRVEVGGNQHGARLTVPLSELKNGASYLISCMFANDSSEPITVDIDWCDTALQPSSAQEVQPGQIIRFSGIGSKSEYNSTFRFIDLGTPAGFTFLVSEIYVQEASEPDIGYFTGDTPGTQNADYSWAGTPGESASIAVASVFEYGIALTKEDSPLAGTFDAALVGSPTPGTAPSGTLPVAQALAVWPDGQSPTMITAALARSANGGLWLDIHLPTVYETEPMKLLEAGLNYMRFITPERTWEVQMGEYYIDNISTESFPDTVKITARDATKKLMTDKLARTSTFEVGTSLRTLVQGQLALAGIPVAKMKLGIEAETLGTEMSFDRGTSRWDIIKSALESFGYERFFDGRGFFVARKFLDPLLSPISFEFGTGPKGNLVTFEQSINDSRIYNHVIVTSPPSDQDDNPVGYFGEAYVTDVNAPTHSDRIGNRVLPVEAAWLSSDSEAVTLAQERLKVTALESYELNFSSIYYPWLEVGEIISIKDPNAFDFEPDRFLMDSISYSLGLGPMSATGKRVTFVGSSGSPEDIIEAGE